MVLLEATQTHFLLIVANIEENEKLVRITCTIFGHTHLNNKIMKIIKDLKRIGYRNNGVLSVKEECFNGNARNKQRLIG